jgi:hypothetical protein
MGAGAGAAVAEAEMAHEDMLLGASTAERLGSGGEIAMGTRDAEVDEEEVEVGGGRTNSHAGDEV